MNYLNTLLNNISTKFIVANLLHLCGLDNKNDEQCYMSSTDIQTTFLYIAYMHHSLDFVRYNTYIEIQNETIRLL